MLLLLFFASLLPLEALAWGQAGHQIIAAVAQEMLTARTSLAVSWILNGSTMANVSYWADDIRNEPGWGWSGPLHFVSPSQDNNVEVCANPKDPGYAYFQNACTTKGCIIEAIKNYTTILAGFSYAKPGTNSSMTELQQALKFLIHFIGDIHQPLHDTGRFAGGTQINVMFDGQKTNQYGNLTLHNIWDTNMVNKFLKSRFQDLTDLVNHVLNKIFSTTLSDISAVNECPYDRLNLPDGRILRGVCPTVWATNANYMTCSKTLNMWQPLTFTPNSQSQDLATNGYYDRSTSFIETQIMVAAIRLNNVLNDIYDPKNSGFRVVPWLFLLFLLI